MYIHPIFIQEVLFLGSCGREADSSEQFGLWGAGGWRLDAEELQRSNSPLLWCCLLCPSPKLNTITGSCQRPLVALSIVAKWYSWHLCNSGSPIDHYLSLNNLDMLEIHVNKTCAQCRKPFISAEHLKDHMLASHQRKTAQVHYMLLFNWTC